MVPETTRLASQIRSHCKSHRREVGYGTRVEGLGDEAKLVVFMLEGGAPDEEIVEQLAWRRHRGPAPSLSDYELDAARAEYEHLLGQLRMALVLAGPAAVRRR